MIRVFDVRCSLFDTECLPFRKIIFLLFLSLLWGLGSFCYAQKPLNPFIFKQFTDGVGTQNNIVSCFLEDKDGFLWVGTADGLKRFEGTNFTIFKHDRNNPNSLAHNEIEALCEDNFGRIWIGSGQGIGKYFEKKKKGNYLKRLI
jgi:hypothetical protein